ncbi:MAG: hypothetical protein PHQ65_14570, partial [Bacteroidales bacterium]|nr:hypothetical protein [Bacteroidales bacterium]
GWQTSLKNNFGHLVVMGNSTFTGINQTEHCVLHGNASFSNFNTFDSLYLAPGKMYQFGAGDVTTITDVVQLEGSCTGSIILQSTVAGVQASISKASGTVMSNYLSLRDMNATGGATFNANNSVDLGNNTGWNITTASPLDLYWVGGTGNWDDPSHWAFSSGGAGGACLPTAYDNVFFDANSFNNSGQVVTINIGNAVCNNLNWTGSLHNPTFAGASTNALRIYGSLSFINAMTNSFQGKVYFESLAMGNTLVSAGQSFKNDVVFQGTGGWTLGDEFSSNGIVYHYSGALSFAGNNFNCLRFVCNGPSSRYLDISGSLLTITGGEWPPASAWYLDGQNLTFITNESIILLQGSQAFFSNINTPKSYNNVIIETSSFFDFLTGESSFNKIQVGNPSSIGSGYTPYFNLSGAPVIDSLISYSHGIRINGNSQINYLHIFKDTQIPDQWTGYTSPIINKAIFVENVKIQGNAQIDSAWMYSNAELIYNNSINFDSIFGNATIIGSYYEEWLGGWQTSLKNNFGHLVVMGNSTFTGINQTEHCVLHGNASFSNFNTFDSLYLAPGKMYSITGADSLKVASDLLIRGNNCFPIQLRSTTQGQQATLWKPDGEVSGDFLELRDINATGGATFFAGSYSTDLGNNTGWLFNNSPGYVYGLGPDTSLCIGQTLSTINFNGAYSYLWQDGSTLPYYTITQPGEYWVIATYATNCSYRDTINVDVKPTPVAGITGANPWICSGGEVQLEGQVTGGVEPYHFSWWPSSGLSDTAIINPAASPAATTSYVFQAIGANDCPSTDTVLVQVAPLVEVATTSSPPTGCGSATGSASATASGGHPFVIGQPYQYLWNTTPQQTTPTLSGLPAGSYQVEATDSLGCTGVATVVLNDPGAPVVGLAVNTDTLCQSESLTAIASGADQYEFFVDGISQGVPTSNPTLVVTGLLPGTHTLAATGTTTGCSGSSLTESVVVLGGVDASVGIETTVSGSVCPGEPVTFITTTMNAGTNPQYQWFVNGSEVAGETASTFTAVFEDQDLVKCRLTSNAPCVNNAEVWSNELSVSVAGNLVVSVSIAATPGNTICTGEPVTFTATPVNGGTDPGYMWFLNNTQVAFGSNSYTLNNPANGDEIYCVVTSNLTCSTGSPATSNAITLTVNPPVAVSINIVASATTLCEGETVTFTASPVNGGTEPHYQWLVNGVNAGTDDPSFAYEPSNSDVVTCQLTSNAVCSTGSPATSNAITLTVNPPVAVSIAIVASATTLCEGETVTFTASPVNGGTEPHYQWLVNGVNAGTDDPSFAYEPSNSDVVTCQLTSNAVCSTGSPATSNAITLTVNPPVA